MLKKIIIKIIVIATLTTVQAHGFSLAFLPSNNYRGSDTCSYTNPLCPYGDLVVSLEYKDGSISSEQTIKCGTVGTVTQDYTKGTKTHYFQG